MTAPIPRWLNAALTSAALVGAVTAVIALLEPRAPALGLGALYLLAVVPIALLYGAAAAGAVSVASMAAFSFFFLPPRHSLDPGTSERWEVLLAFLVSSLVVGLLTARVQREARRSARLVHEQAALRRVATLVARRVTPREVFEAVTREVGLLLIVDATHMGRYEPDGTATGVAAWSSAGDHIPVGSRVDLEGESVAGLVLRTGRPARMHGYEDASGPGAAMGRVLGLQSSVGAPIVVDQRLWGVMIASSKNDGSLPADTESRITAFTELLATAIADAESRADLARLAEEQAALRRVATLVAGGAPPEELFAAVTEEAGRLLGTDLAGMARYESHDTVTVLATWRPKTSTRRAPVGSGAVAARRGRSGIDGLEDGATRPDRRLPRRSRAHRRVRSRRARGRFLGRQPDHRRGAVVGRSVRPLEALPAAVPPGHRIASHRLHGARRDGDRECREPGRSRPNGRGADGAAARRDAGGAWSAAGGAVRGGCRGGRAGASRREHGHGHGPLRVRRHDDDRRDLERPERQLPRRRSVAPWGEEREHDRRGDGPFAARLDDYADASGRLGVAMRERGLRSSVGAPIVVEGRVWGVLTATSTEQPLPADTESRLASFTELVATAIANAENRADLTASRARIVAAADETRKRIERDLHDGTQQRLVSLGLELHAARATVPLQLRELESELSHVAEGLVSVSDELVEISRGIHPAILAEGGLGAALRVLCRRSAVPVELDLHGERRLPEQVEVAAYYVVSEALTNAAKHAHPSVVNIDLDARDTTLQLAIRDDGIGGADPSRGSGLVGLRDRVEAIGGTLQVTSPAGNGTTLVIDVPLEGQNGATSPAA